MPKYLIDASYTAEGAKGLLKDGGTKRRQAAEAALKSAGGTLEAFYFAFGDDDVFVHRRRAGSRHDRRRPRSPSTRAAPCMTKTTVLMTPEEVDQAVKKTVAYTPPGTVTMCRLLE